MESRDEPETPWWETGVQFECQGSGNCCVSRGEYGFVYLTNHDSLRLAQYLKISPRKFRKQYVRQSDGLDHLIDDSSGRCVFLKGLQCSAYEGRPTQCRTWPFWPEVMNPKVWKKEVASFCPGIGKGKKWTQEEISLKLKEQTYAEENIGHSQPIK